VSAGRRGFPCGPRQRRSPSEPTVEHAASRGWETPCRGSGGCRPRSRPEGFWPPLHAVAGDTTPGRRLCRWTVEPFDSGRARASRPVALGCDGNLWGHGPQALHQCTGHGHDHLLGMGASGHESPVPCTSLHLGLPTALWERVRALVPAPWQRSTPRGRMAVGPGPVNEGATGRGRARLGQGPLATPLSGGLRRGKQSHAWQAVAGMRDARQVAQCGPRGDRARAGPTTAGWKGRAPRGQAPSLDRRWAGVVEPLAARGGRGDRADVGRADDGRRGAGPDAGGAPPPLRPVPGGPVRVVASMAAPDGMEPAVRRLASRAGRVAGPWPGVTGGSVDPGAGLVRQQRRRHHPAGVAVGGALPGAPGAPGPGVSANDQRRGRGVPRADAVVTVILAGAAGPAGGALGARLWRDVRSGTRVLLHLQAALPCARLGQDCAPRVCRWRPEAARAVWQAHPRGRRGAADPSEVIMASLIQLESWWNSSGISTKSDQISRGTESTLQKLRRCLATHWS
jgi:hypothetical protein